MKAPHLKEKDDPERRIRDAIRDMLTLKGWFAKITHGSAFSSGWPDIFACHNMYGHRWIECKLPNMKGSKFTPAQLKDFPQFQKHGSGIWVMMGDSEEEYAKLFKPPNWWTYTSVWKG